MKTSLLFFLIPSFLLSQNLDTISVGINNIYLPLINNGTIGVVNGGGKFDNIGFLWSSGFFISGKADDTVWSNAVFDSEGYNDYLPGKFGEDSNNEKNKFYIVSSTDEPFGEQWQNWKDAVDMGAFFYDGNNDGVYNPVDINNNNKWDEDEDRPDLLGDFTAFTVFNDGKPANERELKSGSPLGIEIKQTVFAYNTEGNSPLNNVVFLRYILENVGQNEVLDSVYFGVAADHDIGFYGSDLTGCDTLLNATFGYKISEDEGYYGNNPPSFLVSLLQGPIIKNNSETATVMRGKFLGEETIENSEIIGMTSSYSFFRHWGPYSKDEIRYYLIGGLDKEGAKIDLRNLRWGNEDSLGNAVDTINTKYMFSGNPVTSEGWLNETKTDWRFLNSTGPFLLEKGKPIELIYAYIIGRGDSPLNSVTVAKEYAKGVKKFYESNFTDLPVSVKELNNKIQQDFELYQNYPNPFNPATTIKYTIPTFNVISRSETTRNLEDNKISPNGRNDNVSVTLKIIDVLGREITTLVNKQQQPGSYKVNFNANNLTSGVYFYQLKIGNLIKTKKMILLQ